MPKKIECPFYMYDKGSCIRCEDNIKRFKNRKNLREYTGAICGDVHAYKSCRIAQKLIAKYEEEDKK